MGYDLRVERVNDRKDIWNGIPGIEEPIFSIVAGFSAIGPDGRTEYYRLCQPIPTGSFDEQNVVYTELRVMYPNLSILYAKYENT
ncbi:MAG: hypothetical protein QXY45_00805 [Candidatus Aenigmatarchaeota archaeon]